MIPCSKFILETNFTTKITITGFPKPSKYGRSAQHIFNINVNEDDSTGVVDQTMRTKANHPNVVSTVTVYIPETNICIIINVLGL